jgi:xylan 1,4-beta-xylosidase
MTNADPAAFPVTIEVDASMPIGELTPIWRFFGADEPNYATMHDGRKLLAELGAIGPRGATYFRAHNLLCTGDGTPALKWGSTNAYTEDEHGNPRYDWTIVDGIFDAYLAAGLKPLAQIGFMPRALSTHPDPYQHAWHPGARYEQIMTGWAYPPTDYDKWRELSFNWVTHCVERYGRAEVERWYWEVWNEPNGHYWKASPQEWYKLHDYAIDGVRRALPTARVGGPHTAGHGGPFMTDFLDHCLRGTNHATGRTGTPLDFVAFHAKGSPAFVDGHVRMGIANQLRTIDEGFRIIASYPELKSKPIIIGESDPDGCAACQGPQLGYRNGTMYSSYTAAGFARKYALADRHGVNLEGALTWAFEFEDQPYFAGFRVLATNGIALPVLNVFRMFGRMGAGRRVAVASSGEVSLDAIVASGVRDAPDVSALASVGDDGRIAILMWHYHDDDIPGPAASVDLTIGGLANAGRDVLVTEYRVDENHSNAYAEWKRLGSPQEPTAEQYARLEQAGALAAAGPPRPARVDGGEVVLPVVLPRQAVVLIIVERA